MLIYNYMFEILKQVQYYHPLKHCYSINKKITLTKPCPRTEHRLFHGAPLPETNVCLIGLEDARLISEEYQFFKTHSWLVVDPVRETKGKQNASKTWFVHDFQSAGASGSASASLDDLYGSNMVEVAIILTKTVIPEQYLVLCVIVRINN